MTIKKTVVINKEDINILLKAAKILEAVSSEDTCWAAWNVRDFVKEKPSSRWDINIEWEKGEN